MTVGQEESLKEEERVKYEEKEIQGVSRLEPGSNRDQTASLLLVLHHQTPTATNALRRYQKFHRSSCPCHSNARSRFFQH